LQIYFVAAKIQQIFGIHKVLTKKYRLCSHKQCFFIKSLSFAQRCDRIFEVGQHRCVGVLEVEQIFGIYKILMKKYKEKFVYVRKKQYLCTVLIECVHA